MRLIPPPLLALHVQMLERSVDATLGAEERDQVRAIAEILVPVLFPRPRETPLPSIAEVEQLRADIAEVEAARAAGRLAVLDGAMLEWSLTTLRRRLAKLERLRCVLN